MTQTLTQADNNKSFEMHLGDIIVLTLEENPTTGFRWAIDKMNESILKLLSSDYASAGGGGIGGGGERKLTFKANQSGTTPISLKLWREWEGDTSISNRYQVNVSVNN